MTALARGVLRACGWSNPRLLGVVAQALCEAAAGTGEPASEWADAMRANWQAYVRDGPLLRWTVAPRKWVADGHWRNYQAWPYDARRVQEAKRRF